MVPLLDRAVPSWSDLFGDDMESTRGYGPQELDGWMINDEVAYFHSVSWSLLDETLRVPELSQHHFLSRGSNRTLQRTWKPTTPAFFSAKGLRGAATGNPTWNPQKWILSLMLKYVEICWNIVLHRVSSWFFRSCKIRVGFALWCSSTSSTAAFRISH